MITNGKETKNIKDALQASKSKEADITLQNNIENLKAEGLQVEFGTIGKHTTYALIHNEDSSVELVGYTFIKDLRYYKENIGKLRALQQALARKDISESNS